MKVADYGQSKNLRVYTIKQIRSINIFEYKNTKCVQSSLW